MPIARLRDSYTTYADNNRWRSLSGHFLPSLFLLLIVASVASAQSGQAVTVQEVNRRRAKFDLPPLTYNAKLEKAAQHHANWMGRSGRMIHLEGKKPTENTREAWSNSTWHPINRAVKYGYFEVDFLSQPKANDYVNEAIAHGGPRAGPDRYSPAKIVKGWMLSPGHRKIILGDYKEIGVGFVNVRGNAYWCIVVAKHK